MKPVTENGKHAKPQGDAKEPQNPAPEIETEPERYKPWVLRYATKAW